MAGTFADKHEFGARISRSENNFVSLLVQTAARAFAQILADSFERIALDAVQISNSDDASTMGSAETFGAVGGGTIGITGGVAGKIAGAVFESDTARFDVRFPMVLRSV